MRIARFTTGDEPKYAVVDGEPGSEELIVLSGDPMYIAGKPTGERLALDAENVRLLSPVIPRSKAVCLGKNYEAHAKEIPHRGPAPDVPILFLKPNTAVIGPDDPIVLPSYSQDVQVEAELAIVIGRLCKDVSPESAEDYIYGYTCANDVTARDLQRREDQWFRAKGFDTSLPLGPWIETELAHDDVAVSSRINGKPVQTGHTSDMLVDVMNAVAMVSEIVTLLPGDVILTGTPSGVTTLHHGDVVEIDIEGIGTLRNPVIRRD
ncbi:fumarylacetoacetate hydrolase family protein [Demequina sp. TTPB684]|uniref:fumarylacetoacetate hydrolase family protein n=1 Tax=unclassified Demequina TaxID=2620311 RepID=UPI001CF3FD9B|nr:MULTISPECIES: fumarylacetoacetate hydrolase family protein [unclassified Demequina]MCB2412494.1 fumarylacetoacetate hydrolase family protein [Demequina sp. TTPB684]UPU88801.1 fumarylacetoacetate hydrolase family protein [Demequina sp. TMPB413]